MHRHRIYILYILLLLASCNKENEHPQWDIAVLGPIAQANLGMENLFGDSSIVSTSDGALILHYDTVYSEFELDSIYQIADTTIPTVVLFPPIPSTITPGQAFYSQNNNVVLGAGDVDLKFAIIDSGLIRLEIKNTLQSKINFLYTIPRALKNGIPFSVYASVDSASKTDPKYFSGVYDFSGYEVDLTGSTGNQVNTITYDIVARADSGGVPFVINANDTVVNLKTTLIDIQPYFVRGYLSQNETQQVNLLDSAFGQIIKNGTVELDSIQLNFDIINYIGADAQGFVSYFRSDNTRTGNSLDLIAPGFINQYLNFNRASINSALTDSLVPTTYSVQLDHTNSNVRELMENLPDRFSYDIKLFLNPLGNISGSNDFIYRDRLVDTRVQIKMPLRFAFDQLIMADTLDFTIANATNFDPVGTTTLTLLADNGFPFDLNLQMFLLDSTNTIVDSMFVPDYIAAAPYDVNYKATGSTRTEIKIPIDEERKQKILTVKRVGIRLKFDTPDYPQFIQLYSSYRLYLKLIADGIYTLR
jgi:hypothetical protein